MGAEQSSSQGGSGEGSGDGWAQAQCTALGLVEEASTFNLLSCACTALGEASDEVDDVTFPVEADEDSELSAQTQRALRTARSLRSASGGRRIDEFTTSAIVDEPPPADRPMTFEEATGGRVVDAARRSRAQEVRESEANFMKEFSNMMTTGLTVQLKLPKGGTLPVHLLLAPGGAIEWHYRQDDAARSGRLALDEISSVQTNPDPATLGFDLAQRSFQVLNQSGDAKLFHADSKDICSLLVDGLVMLVKRSLRLKKKKKKIRSGSLKPVPSSSSSEGNQLKDIQNQLPA
mmetsp:Transcript_2896/g.8743  ORF Transcript_2896/g.8743 Transcript_2896/m.8743 type:complete len:290 (-) Transcript_2896:2610-3479(-)